MPRLAIARNSDIDLICRESHALWGGGLSLRAYREFWDELSATPWARRHFSFNVWLDERDVVLSSFKLYRPRVRFLDRTCRACVIGAVFTPSAQRRRRHAFQMLRLVLGEARRRGDGVALLFSDIGTAYYGALGFTALPAEEVWGRLPRAPRIPGQGWELRRLGREDLPAVAAMHDAWCAGRRLAVLRDLQHWEFLRVRALGFFDRLGNPSLVPDFRLALRDGEPTGYLIAVRGPAEWSVREIGARGGDPRLMADLLRVGAAEARRDGMRKLYAWLPRSVTRHLDEWRLRRGPRSRAIPMLLPLDGPADLTPLDEPEASFLPYQDQF